MRESIVGSALSTVGSTASPAMEVASALTVPTRLFAALMESPVQIMPIDKSRKMPKTMLVTQVSTSPVLLPNAVLPPAPPKALLSPPPRPFWMRINRVMNKQTMPNRKPSR